MVTAAVVYWVLNALHFTVDIRNVCVLLAPWMASNTTLITYYLGKEIRDESTGLIAAAFIAIVPGYISRSVAGSYDNEAVAIFALLATFSMFVKAVKTGSLFWSAAACLCYFYMVSAWGGYIFIINLLPLYVFTLLVVGRYSNRLYVAYSAFYTLGTLLSMQITFVGFQPVYSGEHVAAFLVFGLLQLWSFVLFLKSHLSESSFKYLIFIVVATAGAVGIIAASALSAAGYIAPWTGRFYTLLDPTYAKAHIPIISSVSEHQPTTWSSFFFDLHFLTLLFPAGMYFLFQKPTDANIFIILYGMTSVYFAGVMVRLMLVVAPVACIMGAVAVSSTLKNYMKYVKADKASIKKGAASVPKEIAWTVIAGLTFLLMSVFWVSRA
jgi:dolichyl-diphosphooligosaccharide--protein glycosyltransferase